MKRHNFVLALALVMVVGLAFVGCAEPKPEVAEKYRFTGGAWWGDGISTCVLGKDSFTVTGQTSLSKQGVYTEGGGSFLWDNYIPATWEYLYDGSGKIGIACAADNILKKGVYLGKERVEQFASYSNITNVTTANMQNTLNAYGGITP